LRFIDSNVFLHAYLRPNRKLTNQEQSIKDEAKAIIVRVEKGEEVAMTTVHLSEVINIIESSLGVAKSLQFLAQIVTKKTLKVHPTSIEDYGAVLPIAQEKGVGANDALAYLSMKMHKLTEIYSFDKHFNQFKDIQKIPST